MEARRQRPCFGTYKNGEIDFFVRNRMPDSNYGVEVKHGRSKGRTAQLLLEDYKVKAVYFLKGDTYGGIDGRKIAIPVYLIPKVQFDFCAEK